MQTDLSTNPAPELKPQPAAAEPNGSSVALAQAPNGNDSLDRLVNSPPAMALQPAAAAQPPTLIEAKPLPLTIPQHKARRKGKIACLPKPHRDMVNRMLANGAPYKNIVAALQRVDILLTERNVSNWATGGYLEWKLEQDLATQNRLDQDALVDHLRREDASDLPEVGLQAASTRLSQLLVQKLANAEDIEANLGKFSQMVGLLRGITGTLATLQKNRDDSRATLGRAYDVNRVKNEEQKEILETERDFTYPEDAKERGLGVPSEFPLLPPMPISHKLEIEAHAFRERIMAAAGLSRPQTAPALPAPKAQPPASPAPALPDPATVTPPSKPGNAAP